MKSLFVPCSFVNVPQRAKKKKKKRMKKNDIPFLYWL